MSISGLQLPKQRQIQIQSGAKAKNSGGANLYSTRDYPPMPSTLKIPEKARKTISSNKDLSFMRIYGDTKHIDKIVKSKAQVSILTGQDAKVSEGFDITRRNLEHPFHSSPTSYNKFNNQRFAKLKNESRFKLGVKKDASDFSTQADIVQNSLYDIKGNSFKNTLFPKETAGKFNTYAAASVDLSDTGEDDNTLSKRILFADQIDSVSPPGSPNLKDFVLQQLASTEHFDIQSTTKKVIPPREKFQGYQRSGQMLFNNIVSYDTNAFNNNQNYLNQTYNQVVPDSSSSLYLKNRDQNQTLMSIPNYAEMDKTVRFTDRTKERFMNNSVGPTKNRGVTPLKINTERDKTPYQRWQEKHNSGIKLQTGREVIVNQTGETPMKSSSQLQKTMSVLSKHSQPYTSKQLNNFDNQIKNKQESIYVKLALKSPQPISQTLQAQTDTSFESKAEFKKQVYNQMNKWSYFDGNINHALVEQRKIINRKNYELDNRAQALKDYGYQPHFQQNLEQTREIQDIALRQKVVGMAHENLLPFKKNYTPITKFQKSLIDCRVNGSSTGPKIMQTRPYLNVS